MKSQLTTLLWFLWIWYASRKSSSNTEMDLQIILADWKLKVCFTFHFCRIFVNIRHYAVNIRYYLFRKHVTRARKLLMSCSYVTKSKLITLSVIFCLYTMVWYLTGCPFMSVKETFFVSILLLTFLNLENNR